MSLLLEMKMPAALVKGVPALADFRVSNVTQTCFLSDVSVELEGECLEAAFSSQLGEIPPGGRLDGSLDLRPLQVVHASELFLTVKVRRNRLLRETYRARVRCRVHDQPNLQRGDLQVFLGDIQSERAIGAPVEAGSPVVGHAVNIQDYKGLGIDDVLDKLSRDAVLDYKIAALQLHSADPDSFENSLGMHLVGIAPGIFEQGSLSSEDGHEENESHRSVRISKAFWLGKTEVTQGQWLKVMGEGGSKQATNQNELYPANGVSWFEACDFCQKLTVMARERGRLQPGYEYRLPTEAQWEYACRAGTSKDRYGDLEEIAARGTLKEVGSYQPNSWGLYDMLGSVLEWCQDSYQKVYPLSSVYAEDPFFEGGPEDNKVIRGGGYQDSEDWCRAASRKFCTPGYQSGRIGFRVALVEI